MTWTYETALTAMRTRALPDDFDGWHLANEDGQITVAHEAARQWLLPAGFTQWSIANKRGWSVAHEAATHGSIPAGFTQWGIADEDGWTVAHTAAVSGHPPKNVPAHIWRLTDSHGESVWDVAKERGLVTGDPPPLPMPTISPGDFSPVPPLF